MAVARIIPGDSQVTQQAAEYLRSHGYQAEVGGTGDSGTAAEIEIDLRGLSSEEALARAAAAVEERANLPTRRAIAYDITGRPVEFTSDEEPAEEDKGGSVWASVRELVSSLAIPFSHLREWVEESRKAALERRAAREQTRLAEEQRLAEDGRRKQEEIALQLQAEEEERRAVEIEQRRRVESAERERQAAAERHRAAQLKAEAQRRAEEQERHRQQALIEQERRKAAEEADRVEREQQLRRQELQQALAAAAREQRRNEEAARGLMEQFRREARLDARREQFEVEQQNAEQQTNAAEEMLERREPAHAEPALRPTSKRDADWRKAAIIAAGLALLATFGYAAYQSRKPAAPLSNSDLVRSQSVMQPVPFGAATITPPQASPTTPQLPQRSAAPATTHQAVQAPAPQPKRRASRRTRSTADDSVADDEVVIHRRSSGSSAPATSAKSNTGPKHFSDLTQ